MRSPRGDRARGEVWFGVSGFWDKRECVCVFERVCVCLPKTQPILAGWLLAGWPIGGNDSIGGRHNKHHWQVALTLTKGDRHMSMIPHSETNAAEGYQSIDNTIG